MAQSQGWTPEKVSAFKSAFFEFLKHVRIDSKEYGGNYCLADGLYDAQLRFLNGIFDGLANDIHDYKILKSRQLGISSISEALFVFYLGMFPGIQATCVLDTSAHLAQARLRIRNLIKRLPAALRFPTIVDDSRNLLSLSGGATIQWVAAGVRETESSGGLGRSAGCNLLWASEVSSWKNEEGIQSLKETLSQTYANRLCIWESTARGYNHWRDMWLEAEEDDLNQRAIFIGWWAHPLQKIDRTDRRFERYGSAEPTEKEREIIADVKRLYDHDITLEQLAWYRFKIDPTREAEDDEKKSKQFAVQEQPSRASDSFAIAGSSFFDHQSLSQHSARISQQKIRSRNYSYRFGEEFPQTIIQPEIMWRKVELRVWDAPEQGVVYIVAADPAYGRNPDNDRSAVQVMACYADCIEQVAEYACATVNTKQFAWVVASLAGYYAEPKNQVEVIIELDGPGEAVWNEYKNIPRIISSPYMSKIVGERGLNNIMSNVRSFIFNRPDSMSGRGNNWQWKTGNRKEAIMETTKALTSTGQIIIKSMDVIEEMRAIARDGASIEAPKGKHDDRTLAMAFAVRAWEDSIRPGLVARNQTKERFKEAQQMTTQGRWNIYMKNTIDSLYDRNRKLARAAARAQYGRRR